MGIHNDVTDEYQTAIEENKMERTALAAELDEALAGIGGPEAWLLVGGNPQRYPEAFRLAVQLLLEAYPMRLDIDGGWAVLEYKGESAASAIVAAYLQLGDKNNDGSVPVPFVQTTYKEDERAKRRERDVEIARAVEDMLARGECKSQKEAFAALAESARFALKEDAIDKAYRRHYRSVRLEREREHIASLKGTARLKYILSKRDKAS
ncbi:hypothetical protein [Paraburkholderia sp. JPY419]|uniref:hypothetical protein n=1 Tax=Paraburkholderia sp. JPY419 TaxID=667660 RepID=UPI003D23579D